MNIVIIGHVDHGKSTVIGKLLADTGSLPKGKLEQVREMCARKARPFEYAFLLDALKDEQSQGITIDTARCFFKTKKRYYIILDAPGHIEFLKNMVTGAARAEAALLVIDAKEGIQENSKRHGHMVSMLGVKQVTVLVNKMDLVDYREDVFREIEKEYSSFLEGINIKAVSIIPLCAREGDNIVELSQRMPWYRGSTVLEQLDNFRKSETDLTHPFRMPVQDIYKFTASGDERRIVAGTILTGSIKIGDEVILLPSKKRSHVKSIESFNTPHRRSAQAGLATGFTLATQVYIRPGELMVKSDDKLPQVSNRFKANIFWVGKAPLIKNKSYKLKIGAARTMVKLVDIISVLDASELNSVMNKQQVDRHDVGECIFEVAKPIAYDLANEIEATGRFVIVDNYEIAGGGIILESIMTKESTLHEHIKEREILWDRGSVSAVERVDEYNHKSKFVVIAGLTGTGKREIAKALERKLFEQNFKVYYLGLANIEYGLDADMKYEAVSDDERIRRLGELARIVTDSGQIFITTISNADDYDLEKLKLLNEPNEILVVNVGENNFAEYKVDLDLPDGADLEGAVEEIIGLLKQKKVIIEYYI
jgi:bifunctional enzyme CysN/CysC